MYRCGSSRSSSSYSHNTDGTSSFTILFDMPNKTTVDDETINDPYTYYSSSSSSCSSPVDCTLSLGTASTRQTSGHKSPKRNTITGSSCMPTIYWDILSQPKQSPASSRATSYVGGGGGSNSDSLLARRCANCDTTSTPLWRNGPRGPKSLCNACGIRYKKEERRSAAATAAAPYSPSPATPAVVESQTRHGMGGYGYTHDHPWAYAPMSATRKNQQSISLSSSSGRWSDDNDGEETTAMPYLSWCLNVPPPRAEFLHH